MCHRTSFLLKVQGIIHFLVHSNLQRLPTLLGSWSLLAIASLWPLTSSDITPHHLFIKTLVMTLAPLDNLGSSFHLKMLQLIVSAKSLCYVWKHIYKLQKLRWGQIWEPLFCLSQGKMVHGWWFESTACNRDEDDKGKNARLRKNKYNIKWSSFCDLLKQ